MIVAPAARQRFAEAAGVHRKHRAGVVAIAAQFRQIDIHRELRIARAQRGGQRGHLIERIEHPRQPGKAGPRALQHVEAAVQVDQGRERRRGFTAQQRVEVGAGLALHGVEHLRGEGFIGEVRRFEHRRVDAGVAEVQGQGFNGEAGGSQQSQHQVRDFDVGVEAGLAVQLGAELQG